MTQKNIKCVLWIGTEPDPKDRLLVVVFAPDYQKIVSAKGTEQIVTFQDVAGTEYSVRYADCGAACRCALELVD